jgi:hypothetical protein
MTSENKVPVFVATWPNQEGALPAWLQSLEDSGFVVLHPNFDWQNEVGKKVAEDLGVDDKLNEISSEMLERDIFSLRQSKVHIFDIDNSPTEHFLAMAHSLGIPSLAVSNQLQGLSPYFAPTVDCILKPNNVCDYLRKFKKPH